jgi:hypothetical protein
VDKIAVHRLVRSPNSRTPSLEHILLAGVLLGMRIEVEVALLAGSQAPGIEAGQP